MKKFLSVLLALAVAFTFTFGSTMSAFAATVPAGTTNADYLKLVDQDEAAKIAQLEANAVAAKATVSAAKTYTVNGVTVDAEYVLAQLDTVVAAKKTAIADKTKDLKSVSTPTNFNYDSVDIEISTLIDAAKAGDCAKAAIAAQLAKKVADVKAKAAAIDTAVYSTTKSETVVGTATPTDYYVPKDYAAAKIAWIVNEIETASAYDSKVDTLTTVTNKINAVDTAVSTYFNVDATTGAYTLKETILTVAKEKADAADAAAKAAAAKAEAQSNVATAYKTAITKENFTQAEWDKLVAAYNAVNEYLIGKGATSATAFPAAYTFNKDVTTGVVTVAETSTGYMNAVANAAIYETAGTNAKAVKNADGTAKYNAEAIDADVAAYKAAIYATASSATVAAITAADAKAVLEVAGNEEGYATPIEKAVAKKNATNNYEAAAYNAADKANTYYAKEYAAYKALLDTYCAAVDDATTDAEMTTALSTLNTELAKISKASAITYADTATDKAATAEAAAIATKDAYVATLNVGKATDDQIAYTNAAVTEFLKVNGARTAAEIAALTDALKADIAAAETTNQAKAAGEAVKTAIDALPATLTLTVADEAKVLEVKAAYAALSTKAATYVTNASTLTNVVNKMASLVNAALTEEAKTINKDLTAATVTIADKAALKALAEKTDAYATNYTGTATVATFAAAALAQVKDLEKAAVVAAITNLPTDITKDDKAAVEAARAAYDAYVAEYNDLANSYDAVAALKAAGANLEKLEAAEATIAKVCQYTDKDAKAYMFDMTVKVATKKVSSTKAKLTTTVDVTELKDNGYTVKYKYYIKAPGKKSYSLKKTSTKKSYTFSSLKKGKSTLKVKVCVYNADGKLVGTKSKTKTYTKK